MSAVVPMEVANTIVLIVVAVTIVPVQILLVTLLMRMVTAALVSNKIEIMRRKKVL